jgi:hypothetical protein
MHTRAVTKEEMRKAQLAAAFAKFERALSILK